MAIIYSYTLKLNPVPEDLLVISDSQALDPENLTRSMTLRGIQTAMSLVDGAGTARRIPVWVDSNTLADSSFEQSQVGGGVFQVGTQESVYIGKLTNELTSATIPQYNVGIGDESLKSITYGVDSTGASVAGENVAVGYKALTNLTTGTNNVALGVESIGSLNQGANNIAIGKKSLGLLTGPQFKSLGNIALGFDTLGDLTEGNGNIAIGQSGFDKIVRGGNSISLGFRAGKSFTGDIDESIVIGSNVLISSSATSIEKAIVLGHNSGQFTSGTLADDILIGTSAFNATVSAGSNIAIGRVANQNNGSSSALTGSIAIGTTGGTDVGSSGSAGSYSTIIGSYDNADAGIGARNSTTGKYSAILGGLGNTTAATYGVILGGRNNTILSGALNAAILGGFQNSVSGTGSAGMALGSNLIVDGNNQVVVGRYNLANNNTKFIVGSGNDTGSVTRQNAFEVLNTSQIKLAQYETSSGVNYAQAITPTSVFTFLTAGGVSGNVNQLTPPEVSQLPRYLSVNRRTAVGGTPGPAINLPTTVGNVEKISWTGADGSVDVRLAALTPDNRVITFIVDSSVSTGKVVNIKYQGVLIIALSYNAINTATVWYDKLASPPMFDVISCCSSTPSGGTAFAGNAASSSPLATAGSPLATGATV